MYGGQGLSFFAFLLTCCTCARTLFFVCFHVENSLKTIESRTGGRHYLGKLFVAFARFPIEGKSDGGKTTSVLRGIRTSYTE
jgi:hypothetical protein